MKTSHKNIPAAALHNAQKYGKPPVGVCACAAVGYLTSNGDEYICNNCKKLVPHRRYSEDKVIFYGRAGSNIHRITGKYVDCHHLDPTNYVLHLR